MRVVILAVYTENEKLCDGIKRELTRVGSAATQWHEGEVEAVVMEMESTVDNLLSNLRQLKG